MSKSVDDFIESLKKADSVIARLGIPKLAGNVAITGGAFVVDIPSDATDSITKEIIGENSIAITEPEFIKRDDVGLYGSEIFGNEGLVGLIKGTFLYIRQGETNTWFRVRFLTEAGRRLAELSEEDDDESELYEDEDDLPEASQDDINKVAATAATKEAFASLRNKQERKVFVESVAVELGIDGIVERPWLMHSTAELAESCYELSVLPGQCKALVEEGKSIKDIMKALGKTKLKVEKALGTETPDFVREAMLFDILEHREQ